MSFLSLSIVVGHVHLEIGANNATTIVLQAIERRWSKVVLFEPNPVWRPTMDALVKHATAHGVPVQHVPKAAWIHDEKMTFHVHSDHDGVGSSRYSDALYTVAGAGKSVEVDAIDLAAWMLREVPVGSELSVHMDIEGAEYAVMRHLMLHGQACRIRDLTFEGHALYRDDHAPFQMFDALLPWLLSGCPAPRPTVHVKRHYGRRRARGSTMKHDKRIKWNAHNMAKWCYDCRLLDQLVDTSLS